jgi:hypothetical protein
MAMKIIPLLIIPTGLGVTFIIIFIAGIHHWESVWSQMLRMSSAERSNVTAHAHCVRGDLDG